MNMKTSPPQSAGDAIGVPSDGSDAELAQFWSFLLKRTEKRGKELVDSWKGDAEGILIFTGLFSATVAVFAIESYKQLQPDSGNDTIFLLT
ncbi:hypothetical protein BC834DRAFT_1019804, partial [Gloeopeniophorella convolvens]